MFIRPCFAYVSEREKKRTKYNAKRFTVKKTIKYKYTYKFSFGALRMVTQSGGKVIKCALTGIAPVRTACTDKRNKRAVDKPPPF